MAQNRKTEMLGLCFICSASPMLKKKKKSEHLTKNWIMQVWYLKYLYITNILEQNRFSKCKEIGCGVPGEREPGMAFLT